MESGTESNYGGNEFFNSLLDLVPRRREGPQRTLQKTFGRGRRGRGVVEHQHLALADHLRHTRSKIISPCFDLPGCPRGDPEKKQRASIC